MRATVDNAEYVAWSVYYGRKAQRMELAMKEAKRR
jgi:hypothetical protein